MLRTYPDFWFKLIRFRSIHSGFSRGFHDWPVAPVEQVERFLNRLVNRSCLASMITFAFNSAQLFVRISRVRFSWIEILFTATEQFCYLTKYCSLALNNFTAYLSLERWLEVFLRYIGKDLFLLNPGIIKINNCSKTRVILIFCKYLQGIPSFFCQFWRVIPSFFFINIRCYRCFSLILKENDLFTA